MRKSFSPGFSASGIFLFATLPLFSGCGATSSNFKTTSGESITGFVKKMPIPVDNNPITIIPVKPPTTITQPPVTVIPNVGDNFLIRGGLLVVSKNASAALVQPVYKNTDETLDMALDANGTRPTKGVVRIANEKISYQPNANAVGIDTFTVAAKRSSSATMTTHVLYKVVINDQPSFEPLDWLVRNSLYKTSDYLAMNQDVRTAIEDESFNTTGVNTGAGVKRQQYSWTSSANFFATLVKTQIDSLINFGDFPDNSSARWTGRILVPQSGDYTIYTQSDDGVRVFINGSQVIDNWTVHSPMENHSSPIHLEAGMSNLKMEYFQGDGRKIAQLKWTPPGGSKVLIPATNLFQPVPLDDAAFFHFKTLGQQIRYSPSVFFDETYYLTAYPDVAAAVNNGDYRSGLDHFVMVGVFEHRVPVSWFVESEYLTAYKDVADAVNAGTSISAYAHFIEFGASESRNPRNAFNTQHYLSNLGQCGLSATDIGAGKTYTSAIEHYLLVGQTHDCAIAP